MGNLCIIPARGGSKRIPRKNIKSFVGQPIIVYSIKAAIDSKLFEEVMVSTDDEEIAEVARKAGAVVPFMRTAKNSDDFASTLDVIEEVVEAYAKTGKNFDSICCLYPTAPFVNGEMLQRAHEKFTNGNFDSVFPVAEFSSPIQRALKANGDKIEMFTPEYLTSRSQDLETAYHDVGQFYWLNPKQTISKGKIWTDNSSFIVVDPLIAQDIDNESDWELAELKFKYKQSK